MITARNVVKRFGKVRAIDGVGFHLASGESLALWGSNGAGKTTLVRCVLGVIRYQGSVTVDSQDVRRRGKRARAMVGYVPQELAFHDDARLASAMAFFAKLRRANLDAAARALATVGLQGHERKRVRDLSGGMKQRLALAIALLSDPPIVILDEPTSNLDASGRGEVVETLQRLRQQGKTLLFASHRPDEVVALADRVLVLEKGKLLRDVTPRELWPTSSGIRTVRLYLRDATEEAAARVLRDRGHAVNLNGHGLCVAVPSDRKALPMRDLAVAKIDVRDFEFLDDLKIEEDAR